MRKIVVVLVFLAACGAESAATRTSPSSSTSSTSSTTTTTAVVQPPAPADPEGARCQGLVDRVVAEGFAEAPVACELIAFGTDKVGEYDPGTNRAVVRYGLPQPVGDAFYLGVAAHELGHAWDDAHFESSEQRRYLDLREITGGWGAAEEDYADVFAIAVGYPPVAPTRSKLVAPVTPELIAQLRAEGLLPR